MSKIFFSLYLAFFSLSAFSQSKQKEEILAEARLLYNSERTSWHGTDIFLERFPEKKGNMGGYFSYSEGNKHTCIFYDRETEPNVLAQITFDDSFIVETAEVNEKSRKLSVDEKELYIIRKKVLDIVAKDTLFKWYEDANPNFIPLITKGNKRVYVLSGPKKSGVVVFGNDYLIEFDKKNNVKSKKALHKNIIMIEYDGDSVASIHSHAEETGNLITATDICTLMLYCPYTNWDQHIVISDKNVSIWDCKKSELLIMTREAWENISKLKDKKDKKP